MNQGRSKKLTAQSAHDIMQTAVPVDIVAVSAGTQRAKKPTAKEHAAGLFSLLYGVYSTNIKKEAFSMSIVATVAYL